VTSYARRISKLTATLLALALLGAAASGCGRTIVQRSEGYLLRFETIQLRFDAAVRGIDLRTAHQTQTQALAALGTLQTALATFDTQMRRMKPPLRAAALQRSLVKTIERYAAQLRHVAGVAARARKHHAPLDARTLVPNITTIASAVDKLAAHIEDAVHR
jgi:hypothetical protein